MPFSSSAEQRRSNTVTPLQITPPTKIATPQSRREGLAEVENYNRALVEVEVVVVAVVVVAVVAVVAVVVVEVAVVVVVVVVVHCITILLYPWGSLKHTVRSKAHASTAGEQ